MIIRYCPQCKEILIKWVEVGAAIVEMECPHCHVRVKIIEKENIEIIKSK